MKTWHENRSDPRTASTLSVSRDKLGLPLVKFTARDTLRGVEVGVLLKPGQVTELIGELQRLQPKGE